MSRQNSPETDAAMWLLGAVLVFWPIAMVYGIHEGLNVSDRLKYWLIPLLPGLLLSTLFFLGWEVYFLYGFVAVIVFLCFALWDQES